MRLSGKQKRLLRALGHHLQPSVQVGKLGLTPEVLKQIEQNLLARELVKIKVLETCPHSRSAIGSGIEQATRAELAQILGRTLLIYRPHPDEPRIRLPG
jgi:RNA-binding protein